MCCPIRKGEGDESLTDPSPSQRSNFVDETVFGISAEYRYGRDSNTLSADPDQSKSIMLTNLGSRFVEVKEFTVRVGVKFDALIVR